MEGTVKHVGKLPSASTPPSLQQVETLYIHLTSHCCAQNHTIFHQVLFGKVITHFNAVVQSTLYSLFHSAFTAETAQSYHQLRCQVCLV